MLHSIGVEGESFRDSSATRNSVDGNRFSPYTPMGDVTNWTMGRLFPVDSFVYYINEHQTVGCQSYARKTETSSRERLTDIDW